MGCSFSSAFHFFGSSSTSSAGNWGNRLLFFWPSTSLAILPLPQLAIGAMGCSFSLAFYFFGYSSTPSAGNWGNGPVLFLWPPLLWLFFQSLCWQLGQWAALFLWPSTSLAILPLPPLAILLCLFFHSLRWQFGKWGALFLPTSS